MIEVSHNIDRLARRARIKVSNVLRAKERIEKLLDSKRSRGMKLRWSYDFLTKSMIFEARLGIPLNIAIRELKNAGLFVKELAY